MKKVKGIGGIFFKSKDATRLNARYSKHLGFRQAILFEWRNADIETVGGGILKKTTCPKLIHLDVFLRAHIFAEFDFLFPI